MVGSIVDVIDAKTHRILNDWTTSYEDENNRWQSIAIWAERMIREQFERDNLSRAPIPNKQRTVLVLTVFEKLSMLFARFGPVFAVLRRELLASIYVNDLNMERGHNWIAREAHFTNYLDTSEALFERPTWFEKHAHVNHQLHNAKEIMMGGDAEDRTVDAFKKKMGKQFSRMLDPTTCLLRRALFSVWKNWLFRGDDKNDILIRDRAKRRDADLVRLTFNALLITLTRKYKSIVEKLKRQGSILARCPYAQFTKTQKQEAATIVQLLVTHAPPFFERTQGGAVLDMAMRQWLGKDQGWQASALQIEEMAKRVNRRRHPAFKRRIGLHDNEVQNIAEPEPCAVCIVREAVKRVHVGAQTTAAPCPELIVEDVKKKVVKSKVEKDIVVPPLPVETSCVLIADIYDVIVASEIKSQALRSQGLPSPDLSLNELVRDCLNRKYGIRTLANKNLQGLLTGARVDAHPRLEVFAKLWGICAGTPKEKQFLLNRHPLLTTTYGHAFFRLFSRFLSELLAAAREWKPEFPKLSIVLGSKERVINKDAVRQAIGIVCTTVASTQYYAEVIATGLAAMPTTKEKLVERNKNKVEMVVIDQAILMILPWLVEEHKQTVLGNITFASATRIQRFLVKRVRNAQELGRQCLLWADVFERVDRRLHNSGGNGHERGLFTLPEFHVLVEMSHGAALSERLLNTMFDKWHERCSVLGRAELKEKRKSSALHNAAISIQRHVRVRLQYGARATALRASRSRISIAAHLSANRQAFLEAMQRAARLHAIEKAFFFSTMKWQTPEQERVAAIEAERALGPIAKQAFGWTMCAFGFYAAS